MLGSTIHSVSPVNETGYIPEAEMKPKTIGDGNLYGIRFVDHRGGSHTVRMVYKEYGQSFANDLTILPPTIDEEVVIHFDDRDVGQGGFTIGRHMVGKGDVCGEKTGGTEKEYKGNLWNTYPSPAVGIHGAVTLSHSSAGTGETLSIVFSAPYDTSGTLSHPDILGYLGFPEAGLLQLTTDGGANKGITISYTSRSHNDKTGTHTFYGCTGGIDAAISGVDYVISPRINFTSVLTDEVIAAAVEFAMTTSDPTSDNNYFDCRDMFAPDGRTLGEWGVSEKAIKIKSNSPTKVPLSKLFEVSRGKDWGLMEGASSDATVTSKHTGGLTDNERDAGTRLDVGYIPETVLHVTTRYRGTNANTATPI